MDATRAPGAVPRRCCFWCCSALVAVPSVPQMRAPVYELLGCNRSQEAKDKALQLTTGLQHRLSVSCPWSWRTCPGWCRPQGTWLRLGGHEVEVRVAGGRVAGQGLWQKLRVELLRSWAVLLTRKTVASSRMTQPWMTESWVA